MLAETTTYSQSDLLDYYMLDAEYFETDTGWAAENPQPVELEDMELIAPLGTPTEDFTDYEKAWFNHRLSDFPG